jgi:hypothetical protein
MEVKSRLASETSATFYRDVLDESTEPGRYALQEQRKWDQRVRVFYIDAKRHRQVRGDIDIDVLMALFARSRDLVANPELLRLVPDFGRLVETAMTVFFYGIVPRPVTGRRRARSGTGRNET